MYTHSYTENQNIAVYIHVNPPGSSWFEEVLAEVMSIGVSEIQNNNNNKSIMTCPQKY